MTTPTRGYKALAALAEAYNDCELCDALCESRTQVVFGSGSSRARIVVVSTAPAEEEDREGIPFWGDAGRLLMDLFAHAWPDTEAMSKVRDHDEDDEYFDELREYLDEHIFWTNAILCRPPEIRRSRDGMPVYRDPAPAEKKACRDRLNRTIYAIDPLLVVGVGKIAAGILMGSAVQITQKRGGIYDISVPSPVTGEPVRYPMLALLDPAFLLQRGDQDLISRKRGNCYKTIEDLRWALGLLQVHHKSVFGMDFPGETHE